MYSRVIVIVFAVLTSMTAWCAGPACAPTSEIRSEFEKTAAIPVKDRADADHNLAPFLALRQRHPNDLFVHERYQDAVNQYGIEGHVRAMVDEYQDLSQKHADDLMYRYLYARSQMGRNTPAAIDALIEIVASTPNFAPAHRTLAEIYGSENFADARKLKVEQQKFLTLCSASQAVKRPLPLPEWSPLMERAERLLTMNSVNMDAVMEMAQQAVREDEWRLQRIRPFDWYTIDFKRQNGRELQSRYWRLWSLEVRSYRKAGQVAKANEVLATMEQRSSAYRNSTDAFYWGVLTTLTTLYAEGNQKDQATEKLKEMEDMLVKHPDSGRAALLQDLRKQVLRQLTPVAGQS
jgi:hypothetical protein